MEINPMVIAAAIQAAAQLGSSFLGGEEAPEQGYDVVTMPQYDWAEPNQLAASNYYNQGTQYLQQGQLPPGFQAYYDQIQGGMQQDSADRFYGSAGRPGTLRDVFGMGSVTNVGPRAALSKGMQAEYDFMTEGRKIDEYIASLKANEFSKQSQIMPQGLAGLARGPESQIVNMMGGVGGTAGLGGQIGDALGGIGQAFGGMSPSSGGMSPSSENLFSSPSVSSYDVRGLYGSDLGGLYPSTYSNENFGSSIGRTNMGGASPSLFKQYKLSGSVR